MSTFVLPPNFLHATLSIRHSAVVRPMLVTCAGAVDTPPYLQTDAVGLFTDIVAALRPLYDAEYTFPEMVVLVGQDGDPLRFVATGVLAGTRAALNSPPPQVCYLGQKQTNLSGRRNRGRMYLPASNGAAIDQAGRITGAEQLVVQTALDGIETAFASGSGGNADGIVLLHSQPPTEPTPVVDLQASAIVATQRNRLVRD